LHAMCMPKNWEALICPYEIAYISVPWEEDTRLSCQVPRTVPSAKDSRPARDIRGALWACVATRGAQLAKGCLMGHMGVTEAPPRVPDVDMRGESRALTLVNNTPWTANPLSQPYTRGHPSPFFYVIRGRIPLTRGARGRTPHDTHNITSTAFISSRKR